MKKKTCLFVFDIESRGKSAKRHGIVSVGACYGEPGLTKQLVRWNVSPMPGQVFEQRCKEELWDKNQELLKALSRDQLEPGFFAQSFRALLNQLESQYEHIYLICDNPAFDAKMIDFYLDEFGFDSMQYKADGREYRAVHDLDSYGQGMLGLGFENDWLSDERHLGFLKDIRVPEQQKHYPEKDALDICLVYEALVARNNKK